MNNSQKPVVVPKPQTEQEGYTWSFTRVAEGIAINVASALLASVAAIVMLTVPSTIILLLQHIFRFLIVSTNILEICTIIGATILLTLLILAAIVYFTFRHKQWTVALSLLGFIIGTIMDAQKIELKPLDIDHMFKDGREKAHQHVKAQ